MVPQQQELAAAAEAQVLPGLAQPTRQVRVLAVPRPRVLGAGAGEQRAQRLLLLVALVQQRLALVVAALALQAVAAAVLSHLQMASHLSCLAGQAGAVERLRRLPQSRGQRQRKQGQAERAAGRVWPRQLPRRPVAAAAQMAARTAAHPGCPWRACVQTRGGRGSLVGPREVAAAGHPRLQMARPCRPAQGEEAAALPRPWLWLPPPPLRRP